MAASPAALSLNGRAMRWNYVAVQCTHVRYVLLLQFCYGVTTYLLRTKEKVQPKNPDMKIMQTCITGICSTCIVVRLSQGTQIDGFIRGTGVILYGTTGSGPVINYRPRRLA